MSDQPGSEQRTHPRIECAVPVDYFSPRDMEMGHSVANLSHGGACIRTDHPVTVGTKVLLVIELPDMDGATIEIDGEVAWSTPDGPGEMGVRFEFVAPESRELLERYLRRIEGEPGAGEG
jgi:uncharacterized protein (TIGR02266 family)